MTSILPLEQITAADTRQVGGKTVALAALARLGYRVPGSLAIPCDYYRRYLNETGLNDRLTMELGRKDFSQMRWEELWDAALRIRNLFLTTPLPETLNVEFRDILAEHFAERPLVIRSSAPGEDSASCSFAGLHDSFVNISSREEQLLAIRKVWASLWSDRALLYRQELGLDVSASSMAVLVQELIVGEKSGVVFSVAPNASDQLAIEAVWGLNQGMVDGSIEPDFWALDRDSSKIRNYRPAEREAKLVAQAGVLITLPTSAAERHQPVLTDEQLTTVARIALSLEKQFSCPQDCEWTWQKGELVLLQARPITATRESDPRSWYFNLHRSLDNLQQLQRRIENEIMPGMEEAATQLAAIDLMALSAAELTEELEKRLCLQADWEEAYRTDCIPMAHGIRLFGEFYNDSLRPENPFEFIELLRGAELRALQRNSRLATLAVQLQQQHELTDNLTEQLRTQADEIGLSVEQTLRLLRQMPEPSRLPPASKRTELEKKYREHFSPEDWLHAEQLLAVGEASYRLRDDDNISLDKLNRELDRAENEVRKRHAEGRGNFSGILARIEARESRLSSPTQTETPSANLAFRARQLQGQPASPGLATARARVIRSKNDLSDFQRGEILVCDAIDPAMTFIVPLAAGIIERRGGMLIHGAIIAREYGIPCVSGIAAAADIINTGDQMTIDGDLGLVFFPPTSGLLSQPSQTHQLRKELDDVGNR